MFASITMPRTTAGTGPGPRATVRSGLGRATVRAIILAATLALAASGCGALGVTGEQQTAESPGSGQSAEADGEEAKDAGAFGDGASARPSLAPDGLGSDTERPAPPTAPLPSIPEYMSEHAGGPVPETATAARVLQNGPGGARYALVASPSGNIQCRIASVEDATCVAHSTSVPLPAGAASGYIRVSGTSVPGLEQAPADLTGLRPEDGPEAIPYGAAVHYNGVVCASKDSGLTCWDATTSHGAFLSKARIEGF